MAIRGVYLQSMGGFIFCDEFESSNADVKDGIRATGKSNKSCSYFFYVVGLTVFLHAGS